jgi:N-acyl-D-amino-acid deacylase
MFDLVVKNGLVVDGSGSEPRVADVAITDGKIVAVGPGLGAGKEEIDATGLLVTPGFVDVHTHFDAQATWDPLLTPSSWHGVTTAVMGSCGVGFAPARPDRHEWLISLMEGVEDIPGSALAEGMTWGFESFPEYLDVLERQPRIMDIGTQIPHGALRAYVMGERGAKNEPATVNDIHEMYTLAREALTAGALGLSTSRTSLHRAMDGEPVPGTYADLDEVRALGRALKDAGHGIFQCAVEHQNLASELSWLSDLAKETGRTVSVNLSQISDSPNLWRDVLAELVRARASGADIVAQVAGRAIGIVMGLELTAHPLLATPTFLEGFHLPLDEKIARLRDPEVRARLLADENIDLGPFANMITRSYEQMFRVAKGGMVDYEPRPEDSVAAIAAARGVSPREAALDLLLEDDGHGFLYFPLFNYADGNLDLLHGLHQHEATRMGLSDAGAHCGAICDGGMPTFMLSHWARDRRRGTLPLAHMVKRQTHDTARFFGLLDRGLLAPGMKADVNVIDFERLALLPVEVAYDLPAGGRRLVQRARGYKATIASGVVTIRDDEPTGALPGRVIRGPKHDPRTNAR